MRVNGRGWVGAEIVEEVGEMEDRGIHVWEMAPGRNIWWWRWGVVVGGNGQGIQTACYIKKKILLVLLL